MTIRIRFAWYDLWIGAYWDRKTRVLYICPLPTLLLEIARGYTQPAETPGQDS